MADATGAALARRYYMHVQEGGTLTARDVGRMVEALEETFQMYVDANEARIDAEAKLAQQDDLVQAAVLGLMGYDAKAAGAKDAGEGFDLAISMALAAIREGGQPDA